MKLTELSITNYRDDWYLLDKNDFEKLTNNYDVEFHDSTHEKYMLPIIKNDMKIEINYKHGYYFLEKEKDEKYVAYWGSFYPDYSIDNIEPFFSNTQFYITIE